MGDLIILRLTDDEKRLYFQKDAYLRHVQSVYPYTSNQTNIEETVLYHLHPEFVSLPIAIDQTAPASGVPLHDRVANLCTRCYDSVIQQKVPQFSIASGCDYGDIRRLQNDSVYKPLSTGEAMAISRARPYSIIHKLTIAGRNSNRMVLASHMITMPFSGSTVLNDAQRNTFPRPASEINNCFKVIFVGSANFNVTRNSLLAGLKHAVVDARTVYARLNLYKAMNDRYSHIIINNDEPSMNYESLIQLPPALQTNSETTSAVPQNIATSNAIVINRPITVRMDEIVTSREGRDIAHVRDSLADQEENVSHGLAEADVEEQENEDPNVVLADQQESVSSWDRMSVPTTASLLISANGAAPGPVSRDELISRQLTSFRELIGSQANTVQDNPTIQVPQLIVAPSVIPPPTGRLQGRGITDLPIPMRTGDNIPYNEYTENNFLFYDSFPELFLLGRGMPTSGPLNPSFVHHLNNQFTNKFAHNKEFQFLVFNENQRHTAARAVSQKVKNNPESVRLANIMLNDPEFAAKLERALANVRGDDAKSILNDVAPLFHGLATSVPHSAAQRANVITFMYALMQRFGLATSFLTFAPDDTNDIIMLRMCSATKTNKEFPATSEIQIDDTTSASFKDILDNLDLDDATALQFNIPLKQSQKAHMASLNPVSTAKLYAFMQRALFKELLGIDIDSSSLKKTMPRVDSSLTEELNPDFLQKYKGMYGKSFTTGLAALGQALAALGVTEEQRRKVLHTHVIAMTTLKAEILQTIVGHKFLEHVISRVIDSIYKCELPAEVHCKVALCSGIKALQSERMSRSIPPSIPPSDNGLAPSDNELANLKFSIACAATTNIHAHQSPGACDPKRNEPDGSKKCRFGMCNPHCANTSVSQLQEDPGNRTSFLIGPITEIDPSCLVQNRESNIGNGLITQDNRPLIYTSCRRKIEVASIDAPTGIDTNCYINMHLDLIDSDIVTWRERMISDFQKPTSLIRRLTEDEIAAIRTITTEEVKDVKMRMELCLIHMYIYIMILGTSCRRIFKNSEWASCCL